MASVQNEKSLDLSVSDSLNDNVPINQSYSQESYFSVTEDEYIKVRIHYPITLVDDINSLTERLKLNLYRLTLLQFELIAQKYDSRLKFIFNKGKGFHLNDCLWSVEKVQGGPMKCHCATAIKSPETFFDKRINSPPERMIFLHSQSEESKHTPAMNERDETDEEFYQQRVLDRTHTFNWCREYKMRVNILQFQILVKRLKIEKQINVVFNTDSRQYHLTDCIRCVQASEGPDTCRCQKVLMHERKKYLEEKYNFIDVEEFLNKMKYFKTPINYTKEDKKEKDTI